MGDTSEATRTLVQRRAQHFKRHPEAQALYNEMVPRGLISDAEFWANNQAQMEEDEAQDVRAGKVAIDIRSVLEMKAPKAAAGSEAKDPSMFITVAAVPGAEPEKWRLTKEKIEKKHQTAA